MSQDRFSHFITLCRLAGFTVMPSGQILTDHIEIDLSLTGMVQKTRLANPSRSTLMQVSANLVALDRLWIEAGFLAAGDGRLKG